MLLSLFYLELFSLRYSVGVKRRRRYLLYFSISLLTESVNLSNDIISTQANKQIIDNIVKRVDFIYQHIKTATHQFQVAAEN